MKVGTLEDEFEVVVVVVFETSPFESEIEI